MNLIVYFSHKGENYVSGAIKTLEIGNTAIVAEKIQAYAGGDLFEIVPVKEYSNNYYKYIEEAKNELNENARPKYRPLDIDIARYDKVFLCYSNWWGTMPMCVCTFLEDYDFSGKKIFPVCTNEGSGIKRFETALQKCGGRCGACYSRRKGKRKRLGNQKVSERSAIKIIQKRRGQFLAVFVTRPKVYSDKKFCFCDSL